MKNKSVMMHNFGLVPTVNFPRSVFNRSHGYKTTCDSDFLIPILVDPILPGDTVSLKPTILSRLLSSALKPFMDNVYCDVFTFFVPYRLVWDNFKKHMGEQNNPADSISFNIPQITSPNKNAGGVPIGHLFDYFGLPTEGLGAAGQPGLTVNNLVGRSYNKIYNDHFRDENLQNSVTIDTGDGPDTWSNYNLLKRGKRFDYFTACLPNPQKGATPVSLPLGSSATVKTSATPLFTGAQSALVFALNSGGSMTGGKVMRSAASGQIVEGTNADATGTNGIYPQNLYADLTNATASTINALRQSITLQQFLERDARSGTRYQEIVKAHFGTQIPDFRNQRSEIISIFRYDIKMNPVAQTAANDVPPTQGIGTLFGFGTGVGQGHFVHTFTEHGTLMTLMCFTADLTYSQGLERHWSFRTRYDHYWPILANLGEEAILNKEVYANLDDGTAANQKDGVWGYLPRYDSYRFKPSKLTGLMRPAATGTLAIWNLSEQFSVQPTLGATFIQNNMPMDRCISVPAQAHWIVDIYFEMKHARCMPVFAVPGLTRL